MNYIVLARSSEPIDNNGFESIFWQVADFTAMNIAAELFLELFWGLEGVIMRSLLSKWCGGVAWNESDHDSNCHFHFQCMGTLPLSDRTY